MPLMPPAYHLTPAMVEGQGATIDAIRDLFTPATTEEPAMPTPTATAVAAALAAQRAEHDAEIARERETADGRVAAQRSNAAAAARITRDEEVGEALADMVDDGTLDADTVQTIADRLGVEIPTREYEVDVTITIKQTIRVKASNASAAAALAADDESFVEQSLQIGDGISIDGDDDLEVLDDGAAYSDPSVDVSNIQRV